MATTQEIILKYTADLKALQKDVATLKKDMKETEKQGKKVDDVFKTVGKTLASAFAAQKIGALVKEMATLAAEAEGVKTAFAALNDPASLDKLRKATGGTLSDLELMRQSVRAQNFKIPLETLAKGFEFARIRAAQTGESVEFLVNSIIDGIGRKSTLVLDNLGISASELQDEIKLTGDFATAAGNIIERELGKAGDVALTTAQKQQALNAQFENLKVELGTNLLPVLNRVLNVTSDVAGALSTVLQFGGLVSKETQEFETAAAELIAESGIRRLNQFVEQGIIPAEEAQERFNAMLAKYNTQITEAETASARFRAQKTVDFITSLGRQFGFLQANITPLIEPGGSSSIKTLTDSIVDLDDVLTFRANVSPGESSFLGFTGEDVDIINDLIGDDSTGLKGLTEALIRFKRIQQEIADGSQDEEESFLSAADGLQAFGTVLQGVGEVQGAFAEQSKELAIFNIFLSQAVAIARAIEGAAGLLFPANLPAIAVSIAAVLSAFAQTKTLLDQAGPAPKFAEGGIIEGKKHNQGGVLINAEGGEYVIKGKRTAQHKAVLDAINAGKYGEYVANNYVLPTLKNTFAENLAESLGGGLDGYRLERAIRSKRATSLDDSSARLIAHHLAKEIRLSRWH